MSLRKRVYGFLGLLTVVGAVTWVLKTRPAWLPGAAPVKAAGPENSGGKAKKGGKEKEATPVELATVQRGAISSFVSGTANLRALRDVAVATQTEGIVVKVLAEEGDFVKEGQMLCLIDDTQHRIRRELAQEKLAQAKLQMDKARVRQEKAGAQIKHTSVELDRYERAHKEGLVSEKEVATYRYRLEELQHDQRVSSSETKELQHRVSELEAEIEQADLEISRTQVRAPFAGHITQRTVNLGQRVRAMDPLFNLGSFSPLYADVYLSERDTRLVRPGQPAAVHLGSDDGAAIEGRVERLSPIVDQASGTVKVTVALEPKPGFRPGAFVRVEICTDTKPDALLVPKRAVLEEDGAKFVYVAKGNSASRSKVELGYTSRGMVEVRTGVAQGQKIVVAGQGALKEGSKIKVVSQS